MIELARRDCHILVSNSNTPEIAALYETNRDARAAGLQTHRVPARRAINSNASRRGLIDEYMIANVHGRDGQEGREGWTGRNGSSGLSF